MEDFNKQCGNIHCNSYSRESACNRRGVNAPACISQLYVNIHNTTPPPGSSWSIRAAVVKIYHRHSPSYILIPVGLWGFLWRQRVLWESSQPVFPESTSVTSQLLLLAGVWLCAAECWIPHSVKKWRGGCDLLGFKEQFFSGLLWMCIREPWSSLYWAVWLIQC